MTDFELRQRKTELIDLMVDVHGYQYTMGWLRSSYVYPDRTYEVEILESTFRELLESAAKKKAEK